MTRPSIRRYFDSKATSRDEEFEREPVLGYEQRMRRRALLELLDLKPGEKVLDIGCGNLADYAAMHAAGCSFFGLDIAGEMLRQGLKKHPECAGRVVLGDAGRLPFLPGALDKISLSEVIEHIPDYAAAVRSAAGCLKSRGAVVITTPNRRSLYGVARRLSERKHPWEHPYDEWKTRNEVTESVEAAGLEITKARGAVYLPMVYGRHIPVAVQKLLVLFGSLVEPLLRLTLRFSGYLLAVRSEKRTSGRHGEL
jgi:ubiquinone/menaquinone biosynthesis C-methylase UbiE